MRKNLFNSKVLKPSSVEPAKQWPRGSSHLSNPKVWRNFQSFYISEGASPLSADGAGRGEEGGGELVAPPLQLGQRPLTDQAVQEGTATHVVGHSARALELEVRLEGGERPLGGWGGQTCKMSQPSQPAVVSHFQGLRKLLN